eukprot:6195807-Pleurochrysis_carterae.AAC.2
MAANRPPLLTSGSVRSRKASRESKWYAQSSESKTSKPVLRTGSGRAVALACTTSTFLCGPRRCRASATATGFTSTAMTLFTPKRSHHKAA